MTQINTTLLLAAMLLSTPLNSAMSADSGKANPNIPDPSFNRYVDLTAMGVAWDNLDAATLTDTALQLAEGERILHRSHKAGITSGELLKMAIKLATSEKDEETLDRLENVFKSRGDGKMVSAISNARKLSSQSRAAIPGYTVEDDLDQPTMDLYLDAKQEIRTAVASGDVALVMFHLKELKDSNGPMSVLSDAQREQLRSHLALAHVPEGADAAARPSRTVMFLERLKGNVRQWGGHPGMGGSWNPSPWNPGPISPIFGSHGSSHTTHGPWGGSRTVHDSAYGPGATPIHGGPVMNGPNGSYRYVGQDGRWHGKDVQYDAGGNEHVRIFSAGDDGGDDYDY